MNGQGWQLFSARTMRVLDRLLVVYVVVWVILGVLIAVDVRRQATLSDQVNRVGTALTDIGEGLDIVGSLPLIGGNIGELSDRVLDAGDSVQQSGRDSRDSLERMGVVLGLAFIAVPLMLVLPIYLPLRLAWRREVRSVAAALHGGAPDVDLLLARRAAATIPYEMLFKSGADPFAEIDAGGTRALADAELARLGLRR